MPGSYLLRPNTVWKSVSPFVPANVFSCPTMISVKIRAIAWLEQGEVRARAPAVRRRASRTRRRAPSGPAGPARRLTQRFSNGFHTSGSSVWSPYSDMKLGSCPGPDLLEREVHAHRVGAEPEEQALAEHEHAAVAPGDVDADGEGGVAEVLRPLPCPRRVVEDRRQRGDQGDRHEEHDPPDPRVAPRPAEVRQRRAHAPGASAATGEGSLRPGERLARGTDALARTRRHVEPPRAERHDAVRAELQEHDDEAEEDGLADARARPVLGERVDEPEGERRDDGAAELAEAADDHDEEGVDHVAEADLEADGADQRDRHAGDAGQAGAEEERQAGRRAGWRGR